MGVLGVFFVFTECFIEIDSSRVTKRTHAHTYIPHTRARVQSRKQVRAEEATLDASVPEANLTFQHLSRASQMPFKDKVDWFHKQCDLLRVPWDVEHQHLKV